ncbi:restriction endonuclease subunit S [Clostridium beijerinckii]|uniref:Type-1 restriction enzyme EcoKI specificity protein n=1 Tax=Clostridium beijerinckii TaxID=1520 RepID=A0A1S8S3R9_CLOBE|nr:restriction endonuclease subunit S [Clostridium beijerinckii]NRY60649.1 type I restriction enzyme S subunit [Clostridium beijerinckii]OOM60049.1 type-1 restriction enzyme EcoKI specificity protein [Clostridium beijerinckii]
MSKWEIMNLNQVFEFIDGDRGKNYPRQEEFFDKEYCLFLNTGNVTKNGFDFTELKFINKEKDELLRKGKLNREDLILTTRGTVGNCAYYDENIPFPNIRINSGMVILRRKSEIINPNYFIHFIKNRRNYEKYLSGTAQPQLPIANLKKVEIPLPPIEIQKHIAETLDKVTEIINLHKKRLEELDTLIKATFYDMFGDPVSNNMSWEINRMSEITTKIGSGSTPRGGQQSYKENGISLVRSLNVHNGFFKYEQLAYIDDSQAKKLENVILEENDVLINITGASVGRSCVIPKNVLPARVNQHVSILRGIDKFVNSLYLNNLLINNSYQKKLLAVGMAGGATREAITKQQLQNLEIPLPPIELQNKFAQIVIKIEEQKKLEKQAISESENLFNSLMSKYFD